MKPTPRILFITPPPVDDEAWMRDCSTRAADPASGFGDLLRGDEPNRTNAGIKPYVEAMKRVARALDVPIVDLHQYLEFSNGRVDETQFVDGLHFSEAGQRQVASCVVDAVRAAQPQRAHLDREPALLQRVDHAEHQHQHEPPHVQAARRQWAAAPADIRRTSQRARG